MSDQARHAFVDGCALPQAWAGQDAWRILETRFNQGLDFLATWRAWLNDPQRPRMLHYVSLTTATITPGQLLQSAVPFPELLPLAQKLSQHWFGLLPGFHRLALQDGRVLLTLCVGEARAMLREQQFAADSIYLDSDDAMPWDRWTVKALARCCRRGTTIATSGLTSELRGSLTQCGFEMRDDRQGHFNPRWELRHTRRQIPGATAPGSCAVIGAGLAGASVAAALACRGWHVQVLDSAHAPATGASGLPVGLVVPHVSADDSPRSCLSRSGVRLMLQQARRLLQQGKDWQASGVLEHRINGTAGLPPHWPEAGQDWSRPAPLQTTAACCQGMVHGVPTLWHRQAAWVKPVPLIQAWLAQPGVRFCGNAQVTELRREADQWVLLERSGQVLGRASHVVLANACNAQRLLERLQEQMPALRPRIAQLPALHGMRGLLSWGVQQPADAAALPDFPVNGLGSLIPSIPFEQGLAWYAGATYEAVEQNAEPAAAHHQANWNKLRTLLPAAAQALEPAFATGTVQGWGNTRCVTTDRLPIAGPIDRNEHPTLWISSGMGSRGLSFAVLCAELLAARLGAEPWPVEASLAKSLEATRG